VSPLLARAPCPPDDPMRVAVLASGSGTNLQALLDKMAGSAFRVAVVAVNKPDAGAIARAEKAGVPVVVEPHRDHTDRASFETALLARLAEHDVEVVVLAGFMRVLTTTFLGAFERRVINVHPALCPAFPGLHGARQALEHGARITGCTVHLVDAGVDTGPILAQATVPILDDDTEDALQARIQTREHALLPAVVDAYARGQVVVEASGRVRLRGFTAPG
jgi:phosphoribosylglycinamide formyltransferase-1